MVEEPLRIVLLGATGYVGSAILKNLSSLPQGAVEVTALVRDKSKIEKHPFLSIVEGSLLDIPKSIFPKEPHVVIHFASKNVDKDRTGYGINVSGAERLVKLLPNSTVGVIYGSSLSVYGQGAQEGIKEGASTCPETLLAESRIASENIILNHMKNVGKSAVLLRPRFIVSDDDKNTMPLLVKMFKHGVKIGSAKQAFMFIDVDDYAEIIIRLSNNLIKRAVSNEPLCSPLHIGYSKKVHLFEIQEIISRELGFSKPRIKVPVCDGLLGFLHAVPAQVPKKLATLLELIGLSHYGDVSALIEEIGPDIPSKDPLAIISRIVKSYK